MRKLIFELVRPYWGWVIIILLAMLVQAGAGLAAPWPLKIVLDNAVGSLPAPAWLVWLLGPVLASDHIALATLAALSIVLIAVISGIANFFNFYFSESVGQWVGNGLRMRAFHHLDHFSLKYLDKTRTASLLSTVTDDISMIQNFISLSMTMTLMNILNVVGMLAILFWLNFEFALITVGTTPFFALFVVRLQKAIETTSRELRVKQSDIIAIAQEGLQSMRVVFAFGGEDLEEAQLSKASREAVHVALKARKARSLLWPAVGVVVSVCTGIVIWRGASLILSGAMSIGELTVFIDYLNRFFGPLQNLTNTSDSFAQARVAAERIKKILDVTMSMPEIPDARREGPASGEIVFENVSFSYNDNEPVLKDVSFTVKSGQFVGIVGPTGCGKSTIGSLLLRFYDPLDGRISIDGTDIRHYKLSALRSQLALVLQDTFLFCTTVRENIAYGLQNAFFGEIMEAAKSANAHEFISKMPNGYDTQVGERGLTLSGGQRQRIGIARAVLRKAAILILDEPTAALDAESEEIVMEAINRLMTGRTVITIAHRLSTVRNADKIIVLKEGTIVEQGTHDELLSLNKVYAGLYRVQFEHLAVAGAQSTKPGFA
jgi:subfamily B ATP-binding cassette protein MsbA